MSDIPSVLQKIQLEGARSRSAVSESLIQAMGGTSNYLADRFLNKGTVTSFTANGTFVVPTGVEFVAVYISGGGGGGGGGETNFGSKGGGGVGGSGPVYGVFKVTPGDSIAVTVGAGGAGGAAGASGSPGAQGGTSSFGSIVSCLGGHGGGGAMNDPVATAFTVPGIPGRGVGGGGDGGGNILGLDNIADTSTLNLNWTFDGKASSAAAGGAGTGISGGNGGVGGGGAGYSSGPSANTAANANSGAGGGGGNASLVGKAGGSGIVVVINL